MISSLCKSVRFVCLITKCAKANRTINHCHYLATNLLPFFFLSVFFFIIPINDRLLSNLLNTWRQRERERDSLSKSLIKLNCIIIMNKSDNDSRLMFRIITNIGFEFHCNCDRWGKLRKQNHFTKFTRDMHHSFTH